MATCPKKGCASTLITVPLSGAVECPGCNRHALGLCRDCDAKIPSPHHQRCAVCSRRRALALECARAAQRYRRNENGYRDRQLAQKHKQRQDQAFRAADNAKRRQQRAAKPPRPKTPAEIAAERAYHREWRRAHPKPRDKQLRDQARARERYATDPEHRARVLENHRARSARYRERRAAEIHARTAAKKREQWKNDPAFRQRQNDLRRARHARQRQHRQNEQGQPGAAA